MQPSATSRLAGRGDPRIPGTGGGCGHRGTGRCGGVTRPRRPGTEPECVGPRKRAGKRRAGREPGKGDGAPGEPRRIAQSAETGQGCAWGPDRGRVQRLRDRVDTSGGSVPNGTGRTGSAEHLYGTGWTGHLSTGTGQDLSGAERAGGSGAGQGRVPRTLPGRGPGFGPGSGSGPAAHLRAPPRALPGVTVT